MLNIGGAVSALELALGLMFEKVAHGGKVLFVCSRSVDPEVVGELLAGAGQYVMTKPTGGVLTNWLTFKGVGERVKRELRKASATKNKRILKLCLKQASRAASLLAGVAKRATPPSMVVVFCEACDACVVKEANALGVPVVGIADATASVRGIDYVVPVSSSSKPADEFVCQLMAGVCSAANMACERSRASAMTAAAFTKLFNDSHKLCVACLHFKTAFVDAAAGFKPSARRALNLKMVMASLLALKLSPLSPLRSVIRWLTLTLTDRPIGNDARRLVAGLIRGLEVVFGLVTKRADAGVLASRYGVIKLDGLKLERFVPKPPAKLDHHAVFYALGLGGAPTTSALDACGDVCA